MKIIIATGIFIPELGGPATYAAKIAQEFIKQGHQVKIITYSDKAEYDFDKDLPYSVFRIKRSNKILNYFNYFKALEKEAKHSDIIYSFDHFSAGIPAALFSKFYNKDFYIRVGGDFIWERYLENSDDNVTLEEFYEKSLNFKFDRHRFKTIKWVFSQTKGIVFTTNFQTKIFRKYYDLSPEKLFVVNNPIDKTSKIDRGEINKEIIFAGRFINKNNIVNLLEAFYKIDNHDYSLVLIGEGQKKSKIEKIIKDKKISNVKIEKKLSREDLMSRIANAYFLIWPSLTDISPNSMLEALSIDVPIVSTKQIGFEWLKDKIVTFDPQDVDDIRKAIEKMMDKDFYQKYQQVVRDIVYEYDYSQAAKDTIKIFQ